MYRINEQRVDYVKVEDDSLFRRGVSYTPDGCFQPVSTPNPEWTEDHKELKSLISSIAGEKVDKSDVDWYNNEGGGGHVKFDLTTGDVKLYVYANEIQVAHEETETFNLFGKEE
jgi:hypothetical protein